MKTQTQTTVTTPVTTPKAGMTKQQKDILKQMTTAVHKAPRGSKLSTLHLLTIKHSDNVKDISAKEFCTFTKLQKAYGVEFVRIIAITDRLKSAQLNVDLL